jgi:hypothetical protein
VRSRCGRPSTMTRQPNDQVDNAESWREVGLDRLRAAEQPYPGAMPDTALRTTLGGCSPRAFVSASLMR